MAQLTICDETFGGAASSRRVAHELEVEFFKISAADLIRLRVEREYEAQGPQPRVSGTNLNHLGSRPASLEIAIAEAFRGLESNAFFLIVNGRQVRTLDEVIPLDAVNAATFLKLVPLRGG